MAVGGQLEKLVVMAYSSPELTDDSFVSSVTVMMNPEGYTLDYKVDFKDGQGQGTSGAQQKFTMTKPSEFAVDVLFDSTGIIDGQPKDDVADDLNSFRDLLVGFDGTTHEPRHFKVIWGATIFKGRCLALSLNYRLFNPDGTPIRVACKVTFTGSVDDGLRVATDNTQSPDLTHHYRVQAGDTLPLLCYRFYGDSSYYLQVAGVNRLANFRKLEAGDDLVFPPIAKGTAAS